MHLNHNVCSIIVGCVVSKTFWNCTQFIAAILDQASVMPLAGQVD